MPPMPTPMEKKACPTAASTVAKVTLLKSGVKQPGQRLGEAAGEDVEMARPRSRQNISGIIIVTARSMPSLTPA
jgi:hypothetical protein